MSNTTFVSMGHNLFSDKPAVALDPTDLINTDPKLGPLANNGGPTETQALLPGSPAIGAGVAIPGITTDQRGVPRPQGTAPDIGAFQSLTPPVVSVQRLGVHQQPTRLLIFFNGPLDPTRAEDTSNYILTTTGRRPRAIAIDRATYDPATRSVTLFPHERLSLFHAYQLTVHGGGPRGTDFTTEVYGGGFPRWVGATGPGLSNSPLGTNRPSASAVDVLFSRSGRLSAQRHRR